MTIENWLLPRALIVTPGAGADCATALITMPMTSIKIIPPTIVDCLLSLVFICISFFRDCFEFELFASRV